MVTMCWSGGKITWTERGNEVLQPPELIRWFIQTGPINFVLPRITLNDPTKSWMVRTDSLRPIFLLSSMSICVFYDLGFRSDRWNHRSLVRVGRPFGSPVLFSPSTRLSILFVSLPLKVLPPNIVVKVRPILYDHSLVR